MESGPPGFAALTLGLGVGLPVDAFDGFAHAEAVAKLFELLVEAWVAAVHVLALGDELEPVVAVDAQLLQEDLEGTDVGGVDDQELVLIELDLHGALVRQDGDAGAAVVGQQIFEFAAMAL